MNWSLFAGVGLLSLVSVSTSILAAEVPLEVRPKAAPKPLAQPVQAPVRPVISPPSRLPSPQRIGRALRLAASTAQATCPMPW